VGGGGKKTGKGEAKTQETQYGHCPGSPVNAKGKWRKTKLILGTLLTFKNGVPRGEMGRLRGHNYQEAPQLSLGPTGDGFITQQPSFRTGGGGN